MPSVVVLTGQPSVLTVQRHAMVSSRAMLASSLDRRKNQQRRTLVVPLMATDSNEDAD
jgi:hypothetical protein